MHGQMWGSLIKLPIIPFRNYLLILLLYFFIGYSSDYLMNNTMH
uniref:Uncharacterized protein n=1 Tax=Arundo donax TaxID=35708 RepID=A0A0A8Z2L9_ARUDO